MEWRTMTDNVDSGEEPQDKPAGSRRRATGGKSSRADRTGGRPAPPGAKKAPRALAELSQGSIFIVDDQGRVLYVNASAAKELGRRPEELVGQRLEDLFPRDVTECTRAVAAFQISEAELSAIFRDAPLPMILVGPQCRVQQVNRAAARFAQRRAASMVGVHAGEAVRCLHALDNPKGCGFGLLCKTCELRAAILDTLKTRTAHARIEIRLPLARRGQEGEVDSRVSTIPLSASGRRMALVCLEDITARKSAEQEREKMQALLLHAQKMEAIGVLAGGVAHDFNNLLTVIQGNAQLAMTAAHEGDRSCADLLKKAISAAEHGASLVRQLLVFSRKQPMELMSLDLNKTVGDLFNMLGRLIGEDITIDAEPFPALWSVRGDETNLEQLIMNLAVNARDAMPEGGRLTIKTENVLLDETAGAAMPEARPGRFVRLTVADTGIGMEEEIIQHIFEPFFTTKQQRNGSGLGLSVVYGIVKQHEGWITVSSRPRRGSRFQVYLPASFPKPEEKAREQTQLNELRGSGERILLIEDHREVREFAKRALNRSGYRVISAADAEEAEDIFAKERGNFHLVLSDVVLPGRSGVLLAERLLSLKPDLRVMLTSGYADERSQWPLIRERGFAFLQKPYTLMGLLRATKGALRPSC